VSVRVLVADDVVDNRKLLEWMLEDAGWGVAEAGSGEEVLELLGREPFDLVLMDVSMPGMGGVEATRRIRADLALPVKVVAVTAHAAAEDRARLLATGFDAVVTKPVDEATLLPQLEALLRGEV